MGDQLPWPEDVTALIDKGPLDKAAIYHSGERRDCEIRKISALGATISCDLEPALGDKVAVELVNGQRASGKVAWARRNTLGVRFDDNVDVVALLNRKLVSQAPERRTMPRLEVRCPLHLKCGEHFIIGALRNISAKGLQVEGDELPPIGTFVSVFVEGLHMPGGEIVWRQERLAGIELFEELSWTSIIPWVRTIVKRGAN